MQRSLGGGRGWRFRSWNLETPPTMTTPEEELVALREQATNLEKQQKELKHRITELEKSK
jgi:hypothetical protein